MIELTERLGRFGHHPEPAIDFCVEVECCENDAYDLRAGGDRIALLKRINRAMTFRVGGDANCVDAKHGLRQLHAALFAGTEGAFMDSLIESRAR